MKNFNSAEDGLTSGHIVAIRNEIGEKLRSLHDQARIELPSNILKLMIRLTDEPATI